ncbi:hypothetical protein SVIOM342S_08228 [Streptomyces violaceorubidus]
MFRSASTASAAASSRSQREAASYGLGRHGDAREPAEDGAQGAGGLPLGREQAAQTAAQFLGRGEQGEGAGRGREVDDEEVVRLGEGGLAQGAQQGEVLGAGQRGEVLGVEAGGAEQVERGGGAVLEGGEAVAEALGGVGAPDGEAGFDGGRRRAGAQAERGAEGVVAVGAQEEGAGALPGGGERGGGGDGGTAGAASVDQEGAHGGERYLGAPPVGPVTASRAPRRPPRATGQGLLRLHPLLQARQGAVRDDLLRLALDHAPEQVQWILGDSGATACVVESAGHSAAVESVREQLPALKNVWQIDAGAVEELGRLADVTDRTIEERGSIAKARRPATIVYTSAPTGRPKGCVLTHRSFFAECGNVVERLRRLFRTGESVLLLLPLAHVFGRLVQVAPMMAVASWATPTSNLRRRTWPPSGPR